MIDRRRFISLGLSLLAAKDGRAQRTRQDPIVVVGAGLSGMSAAMQVRDAGGRVVVLEAQSRAGGRVRTIRSPFTEGLHAEAGAARVASNHELVIELVRRYGLTLIPFQSESGASLSIVRGTAIRTEDLSGRANGPFALSKEEQGLSPREMLEHYVGDIAAELGNPQFSDWGKWSHLDRLSWHRWLRAQGATEDAVELMTLGGDSRDLSCLYVLRQIALLKGSSQYFKIEGGTDLLTSAISEDLMEEIRYQAKVVKIDRSERSVAVTFVENGAKKEIHAAAVIVAIPLPVLKNIEMNPALDASLQQSIKVVPYYPVTRVLLQFRERFWHDRGLSGAMRADWPAEIWDATYDQAGEAGILSVTLGGKAAGPSMGSPMEVVQSSLQRLERSLPGTSSYFQGGSSTQWSREKWAQGAFAVFRPGQMSSLKIEAKAGLLFFAGEHLSGWMGWMEGAIDSGKRAAQLALRAVA